MVTVLSPFPAIFVPRLWRWLQDVPLAHFDDDGPTTLDAFTATLSARAATERTWAILCEDRAVGYVGYQPMTARTGTLHGICVTREVWGTGVAADGVQQVFDELFASGVEKISATFFADNTRVRRFLEKQGAVVEGRLVAQTVRGGVPIDLTVVGIFNPAFQRKAG